jgi:2-polyprenyl-3-methyl-5-hydroxy-6-metoxy-1,4-benzoquinol methylase
MFYVLEHLPEPSGTIALCLSRLAPSCVLYIAVPNINDAFLSVYDCEAYRRIYFFKDHLHCFSRRLLT